MSIFRSEMNVYSREKHDEYINKFKQLVGEITTSVQKKRMWAFGESLQSHFVELLSSRSRFWSEQLEKMSADPQLAKLRFFQHWHQLFVKYFHLIENDQIIPLAVSFMALMHISPPLPPPGIVVPSVEYSFVWRLGSRYFEETLSSDLGNRFPEFTRWFNKIAQLSNLMSEWSWFDKKMPSHINKLSHLSKALQSRKRTRRPRSKTKKRRWAR